MKISYGRVNFCYAIRPFSSFPKEAFHNLSGFKLGAFDQNWEGKDACWLAVLRFLKVDENLIDRFRFWIPLI